MRTGCGQVRMGEEGVMMTSGRIRLDRRMTTLMMTKPGAPSTQLPLPDHLTPLLRTLLTTILARLLQHRFSRPLPSRKSDRLRSHHTTGHRSLSENSAPGNLQRIGKPRLRQRSSSRILERVEGILERVEGRRRRALRGALRARMRGKTYHQLHRRQFLQSWSPVLPARHRISQRSQALLVPDRRQSPGTPQNLADHPSLLRLISPIPDP